MESTFLLLGACVVVPWVLELVLAERGGRHRLARIAWIPAAACLCASHLFAAGTLAFWLALPWCAFASLVAFVGLLRAAERGGGPVAELAIDAGLVFFAIGGVWTLASRAGSGLLGFGEPWVLLTALHFHYAGLALPILTGRLARHIPGRLGAAASVLVSLGVPVVAIGIMATRVGLHWPELLGACLLALGSLLVGVLLLHLALREKARLHRALALVAGLALLGGTTLAAIYAVTRFLGAPALTLPEMVRTHAVLQVVGFVLPALVLVRRMPRPAPLPRMEVLVTWLGDLPTEGLWETRPFGPALEPGAPGVATDHHEAELPAEGPGMAVPGGPFERAARAVLSYRVFAPTELWGVRPPRPVTLGETVRARYRLLPGLHLVFAARVTAVLDGVEGGVQRAGFSYRTLAGHPECGVETFLVEKDLATGRVRASLHAQSRPGTPLARLLRPLCRHLQLAAGRRASARLQALGQGSTS